MYTPLYKTFSELVSVIRPQRVLGSYCQQVIRVQHKTISSLLRCFGTITPGRSIDSLTAQPSPSAQEHRPQEDQGTD